MTSSLSGSTSHSAALAELTVSTASSTGLPTHTTQDAGADAGVAVGVLDRTLMRRMYLDTMQTVFSRVAAKVLLDSGRAVDLTILKDPQQ